MQLCRHNISLRRHENLAKFENLLWKPLYFDSHRPEGPLGSHKDPIESHKNPVGPVGSPVDHRLPWDPVGSHQYPMGFQECPEGSHQGSMGS